MAQKDRAVRRIDERSDNLITGGGQLIVGGQLDTAPPGIPNAPEPENVTIGSQALIRSTLVPKVIVQIDWDNPPNVIPEAYIIQAATNSGFTTGLLSFSSNTDSAGIELNTDTDYYVRVQAIARGIASDWAYPTSYPGISVHTMTDTTPPLSVNTVVVNWQQNDLIISWTNPQSNNFFQTRVRIYDPSSGYPGALYKEVYIVGQPSSKSQYIFTADENKRVTGGTPLTTVYYDLTAYSIANVPATTIPSGVATKAVPTIPGGLTNTWSGDDGTYDEGVTIAWNAVSSAVEYVLVIDGVSKTTPRVQYTYTYTENVSDHRPTLLSGDYSLAYTVRAKDALGQLSGGASGTATNIAPQSSNLALTTVAGFSSLYAYITPTKEILDLYGYRWTLKSGGVNVQTVTSFTPEVTFTTLNGSYILEVYGIDLFGQKSTTLSGAVSLDGLTIAQLRAETTYTNSLNTPSTSLTGLKDGNLLTSVITLASGTTWQWHKAERPLLDRYRTVTVAFSGAATNMPRVYFGTSSDDTTYRWFSGPLVSTGAIAGSTTLTEYGSEASAQSNAVLATNINRYDFPSILEARFVKMGHRGNTHNLAEYYPRRIIQSDDMEAETIKSINIAAGNILADHISVTSLAAITIWTGALTVSGVISIHTAGGIYQGTGSFSSPTTGLKIYNTSGIGRLTTFSGGTTQIDLDTQGRLLAGAGAVVMDNAGLTLGVTLDSGYAGNIYAKWKVNNILAGDIGLESTSGGGTNSNTLSLNAYNSTGASVDAKIELIADKGTPSNSSINFTVDGSLIVSISNLSMTVDALSSLGDIDLFGGLSVGSAMQGLAPNGAAYAAVLLSSGASNGIIFLDRTGGNRWQWYGSGDVARLFNGTTDTISITDVGAMNIVINDAVTNTNTTGLILWHRTSGTAANGFGFAQAVNLEDDGGTDRTAADLRYSWATAASATRKARVQHVVYDTAAREFLRGEASGTAPMIGFLGSAASAKLAVTGSRGGNAALASLLTQLATYGLITDSSSA